MAYKKSRSSLHQRRDKLLKSVGTCAETVTQTQYLSVPLFHKGGQGQYCSLKYRDAFCYINWRNLFGITAAHRKLSDPAFNSTRIAPIAARYNPFVQYFRQYNFMEHRPVLRGEKN